MPKRIHPRLFDRDARAALFNLSTICTLLAGSFWVVFKILR